MGVGVVGFALQRLEVFGDGVLVVALHEEGVGEIVVRVERVGPANQGGTEFLNGLVHLPLLAEGGTEVDADVVIGGAECEGLIIGGDGVVEAVLGQVAVAEVGVGQEITVGDGGGVVEDGFVVVPEGDLVTGDGDAGEN